MSAFQDWIDANLTAVLEYKCNEASGNLLNTGSATSMDLTTAGAPTYQFQASRDYEGDTYSHDLDGIDDGWYIFNMANWASGLTSGTFIAILGPGGGASGDALFTFGSDYLSKTTGNWCTIHNDATEVGIEGYSGSTKVLDITVATTDEVPTLTGVHSHVLIITQPADGGGPIIYLDGIVKTYQGVYDTITSPNWWFGSVTSPVSTGIGVLAQSLDSGSTLWNTNNEWDGWIEYLGIFSETMTNDQVRTFTEQYYGGGKAGPTYRTGRTEHRRYWSNQIVGGSTPTGLEALDFLFVNGGNSTNYYHTMFRVFGPDRLANLSDDIEWGEIYPSPAGNNWGTATYNNEISPDGKWLGLGDDGTATASVSAFPTFAWHPGGYWIDARYCFDDRSNAGSQYDCSFLADSSAFITQTNNNASQDTYVWDGVTEHWDRIASPFDSGAPTRGGPTASGRSIMVGRNACDGYLALSTAATTGQEGMHIFEWNSSTPQWEVVGWTGRVSARTKQGAFMSQHATLAHAAFAETSATTTVSASNAQIIMYKRTGAKTWARDDNLLNNGVAHPDQDTNTTTFRDMLWVGDDLYAALDRSAGSYNNLLHWRWNGSYYAAQSSITLPGSGASYFKGYGLYCTPDGTKLLMSGNTSGAGIPDLLVFTRNTSTGALTIDDTPAHTMLSTTSSGHVLDSADTDRTGTSFYKMSQLATADRPTTPGISTFVSMYKALDPAMAYNFRETSGNLSNSPRTAGFDMTVEGSGHTYGVTGGDQSGKASLAVTLNGSGGWMNTAPGTGLDAYANGIIVFCGKYTSSASTEILRFSNAADTGNSELVIGVNASNDVYCEVFNGSGSIGSKTDGGGFDDGEYHIWVFKKNGTALDCWVDGTKIGTATTLSADYWLSGIIPGTNCDEIGLGGQPNAGGTALTARFVGTMDFLFIDSTAMADNDIKRLSLTYLIGR